MSAKTGLSPSEVAFEAASEIILSLYGTQSSSSIGFNDAFEIILDFLRGSVNDNAASQLP